MKNCRACKEPQYCDCLCDTCLASKKALKQENQMTLECPECGERENIIPEGNSFESLDKIMIHCKSCGYKGRADIIISDCKGEEKSVN